MTSERATGSTPSFGERLWSAFFWFLRVLWRLLLILIIIGIVAAVIYFGGPTVYNYLVVPVQENTAMLEMLAMQYEEDRDETNAQIEELTEQLGALELALQENWLVIEEMRAAQAVFEVTVGEGFSEIETGISQANGELEDLSMELESLQNSLDEISPTVGEANEQIDKLKTDLHILETDVHVLKSEVHTNNEPILALYHQIQILKAMELITRSRLYITQSNLGLAERDIQAARDLLAELRTSVYSFQVEMLTNIIMRLDLALKSLLAAPDLAADDLEIAWQLMVQGLPSEPTITPEINEEQTISTPTMGTPEVIVEATITPTLTATQTP